MGRKSAQGDEPIRASASPAAPSGKREGAAPSAEPMTMATDFFLAAVAGLLAARLLAQADGSSLAGQAWGAAFAATALAAAAGGVFHGVRRHFGVEGRQRLWRCILLLSALTSCLLLLGAALALESASGRALLLVLAPLKLLATGAHLWRRGDFAAVNLDAGASLLLILAATFWRLAWGAAGSESWWIVAGVGTALAGSLVQQSRWHIGGRFDHNDFFHVTEAAACYLLYRGALHL